jgi:NADH:ubiquinone oxidoreductase subunit 2 (subunit N)
VTMYMHDPESEPAPIDYAVAGNLGLIISVLGVLLLGIFPDRILELLRVSAGSLF